MIRVNQIRQAGQQYEVPESSASDYYFNAKLVTYGKPNFDSALTGGRVSTAEFTEFRAKIIEAGGSLLNKVRIVFYLRFLVAGFSLIFCALRTTLRYVHGMSLTPTDPYIMMAVLIIPNLIINYIWSKIAGKFTKKVQDAINQENTTTFREKGVTWKISSSLLYFQVTMRNDNTYRPPQHLENVLTSYPIKMQPARPGQQEPQQPSSMLERFPGLVLEERQDNRQYPNAQNQPEIVPLNPNPHPPINSQPLRTVNTPISRRSDGQCVTSFL